MLLPFDIHHVGNSKDAWKVSHPFSHNMVALLGLAAAENLALH